MVQTLNVMLNGLDAAALEQRMRAAGQGASAVITASGIAVERIDVQYELDMHYLGQTHTVTVPLSVKQGTSLGVSESMVQSAFEAAYLASFSRLLPGIAMRIVSRRVAAIGRRPPFDFAVFSPEPPASVEKARLGARPVWFEGGWRDTAVWARLDLPVDAEVAGPAILEQPDATTVIEPGLVGRIDRLGNLIVEPA
jgi:N-methylhydantoinase A